MSSPACQTVSAWSNKEVQTFLSLLAEDRVQRELDGSVRNEKVFQALAEAMSTHGFSQTSRQCCEKLKKLKSDYRAVKDHSSRSGADRRRWKWFAQMDAIYGKRPASSGRESGVDRTTPAPTLENGDISGEPLPGKSQSTADAGDTDTVNSDDTNAGPSCSSSSCPSSNVCTRSTETRRPSHSQRRNSGVLASAFEKMADADNRLLNAVMDRNVQFEERSHSESRAEAEYRQAEMEQRRREPAELGEFNRAFLEVLRGLVSAVANNNE